MKPFTIDMGPTALRALWQTGQLNPEDLPEVAAELLISGADSQALRELAGLARPTRDDAEPVLARVLRDLGAPALQQDVACRVAARATAARALAGAISPHDAAVALAALCAACDWPPDLGWFVAALYEWVDVPHERPQIAVQILEECQKLLAAPADATARGPAAPASPVDPG
jgi:hypothetical protein